MIKDLGPLYDLIRADGSIVVNKNLIFVLGHTEATIYVELISKFKYFCIREDLTEDGYFFNTVDNLYLDTGYNEKPQRAAIKKLKKIGLIDFKVKGMPPKRYFKIIDNTQLLFNLIEEGKEIREQLEKKQLEDIEKSKLRIFGGIKNSKMEELIPPNGSVNNTKLNNTKLNNTKERYVTLNEDDNLFFKIYDFNFQKKFGKPHMRIKYINYLELKEWITDLIEYGIDTEYWTEGVKDHFSHLSATNNGNILSFMASSIRYFEVPSPKQKEQREVLNKKYGNG